MNFRQLMLVALLVLGITGVLWQNAMAAQRLGLHFTDQELSIWRQRAANGPYKSKGDVSPNSPGDWNRIESNANAFASNPSQGRWTTGPTGFTSAGCVAQGSGNEPGSAEGWAHRLRDAAFYDLVKGVTTHHADIKAELLWQAQQPWADFSNTAMWCTGVIWDINPGFIITAWLTKSLFAYGYVGRDAFSSAELRILDTWFWHAADYWRIDMDVSTDSLYVNRWNADYTPKVGCQYAGAPYVGGPQISKYSRAYANRRGSILRFSGLVGIFLDMHDYNPPSSRVGANIQTLKDSAKMFIKEWIRFGLLPQGVHADFLRAKQALPDLGWGYATAVAGEAVVIADHFARTGDTELYTFSTTQGTCGSEGPINDGGSRVGQPRDLLFGIQITMKYMSDEYARYYLNAGNPDYRIDGRNPRDGSRWHGVHETNIVPANVYYQDNDIRAAYMRTKPGTVPYPSQPIGGPPPWTGENGIYPGVLFMFGDIEGKVSPYPVGGTDLIPPSAPTNLRMQ